MNKIIIPNNEALSVIEDIIRNGDSVRIKVRGNSMAPLLIDGVDSVTLIPLNGRELKVGDIIFFRHKGSFLMHRVVKTDPASRDSGNSGLAVVTKGDALNSFEETKYEEVIAIVVLPARYTKKWYFLFRSIVWLIIKIYTFALRRFMLINSKTNK